MDVAPILRMKESKVGRKSDGLVKGQSVSSLPLILDIDKFKGEFSFDALFGNLVNDLPSFQEDETDSSEGHSNVSGTESGTNGPLFPEVDKILSLFKDYCKELVNLHTQIDGKLLNLKKYVSTQDSKHRKTLTELEKGVDTLFSSFSRLDSRISSVGQTAAKIGDLLQSADAQRETASQSIELIKVVGDAVKGCKINRQSILKIWRVQSSLKLYRATLESTRKLREIS